MAKARVIQGSKAFVEGRELEAYADVDKPIGSAFERCLNCFKDTHTHERVLFVYPRGATVFEVEMKGKKFRVDSNHFIVLPGRIPHSDRGITTVYDVIALFPDDPTLHSICDDYKIARELPFGGCYVSPKTAWLKESIEKFYFDKFLGKQAHPTDISLLETQILRESFRLAFMGQDSKPEKRQDDDLQRALKYLEANLFEKLDLDSLAKIANKSKTSFIRAFKAEFALTPIEYVRKRRLDESCRLLQSGKYTVSEVALLVGYSEHAAFHHAFRAYFGKSPSVLFKK